MRTNHENTSSESFPKSIKSTVALVQFAHWCSGALREEGGHGISRVGDGSAEDTGTITSSESKRKLLRLVIIFLIFSELASCESVYPAAQQGGRRLRRRYR